jgi:hypothetical protein
MKKETKKKKKVAKVSKKKVKVAPVVEESVAVETAPQSESDSSNDSCDHASDAIGYFVKNIVIPSLKKAEEKSKSRERLTTNSIHNRDLIQKTEYVMAFKPEIVKDGDAWLVIIGSMPTGMVTDGPNVATAISRMHFKLTQEQ